MDIVSQFQKLYGTNQRACHWVKILRKNTNGSWGPQGKMAITFRQGLCKAYMPQHWVEACLKDSTCEVYPRMSDASEDCRDQIFADDERSVVGEPFRNHYHPFIAQEALAVAKEKLPEVVLVAEQPIEQPKKRKGRKPKVV